MSDNGYLGWHFLSEDGCLAHTDPPVKVMAGETYRVAPPLVMCKNGLHASAKPLDALQYAPGPIICQVRLSGEIIHDSDKACATERTVLWLADATRPLHEFALWCAEQALHAERAAGREPDERSWNALLVKRRWLDGQATDAELTAVRAAAWDAACDAVSAAAWSAARYAASAAARAAQNVQLEAMLMALAPEGVQHEYE